MKIGEFCNKHNVTIDTVRHYIDIGLLTPLKENTQFSFCEIDDRVMDSIVLLKSMGFKLEEMKPYLLFQTIFTKNMISHMEPFRDRFVEKIHENEQIIANLTRMNDQIKKHMTVYQTDSYSRGIPIGMTSSLCCPVCGREPELNSSSLIKNEVMEGELVCPGCGKRFVIREGVICAGDDDEQNNEHKDSQTVDSYTEKNDTGYILKVREMFRKAAEISSKNSAAAKNVLLDGESTFFLNSSILRSIPSDAHVFIHINEGTQLLKYMEDIFPKNTVCFRGSMEDCPFGAEMDYVFCQNYDTDMLTKKTFDFYERLSPGAKVDLFKAYVPENNEMAFGSEKAFLDDMKKRSLVFCETYKTDKVLIKKESSDMEILKKQNDMEVIYSIYSFKTLG